MNPIVTEVIQAGREVLRISFVDPVKEGHPRPSAWPHGTREVGVAVAAVFATLIVATLLSTPLRQWDTLVVNPFGTQSLPSVAIPLLLTAVVLTFAMVLTAALHAPWWLRVALLVISFMAALSFTISAVANPIQLLVSGVGTVVLLVFALIRAFRHHAWWEFPVVLALLTTILIVPWGLPGYVNFGPDLRMAGITGGFEFLMPLILPAVMVAGFAPAQIVVTGAQAIADRPVSRGLFWTVFGLAVVALAVSTYFDLTGDQPPTLAGVLGGLARLVLVAGVTAALVAVAKARRPPAPAAYPEAWNPWVYPIAAGLTGLTLLISVVLVVHGLAGLAGVGWLRDSATAVYVTINEGDGQAYYWLLIAAVTLVGAWRLARRARLTEAIMLGAFGVMTAAGGISQLRLVSLPNASGIEEMGLIASVVALVAGAVHLVRRRFDRGRATGVLTVLVLNVLYPHRDALSDPISTALVVAPAVMVVFGLLWRVITEAQITYDDSKRYPQSTRVYLFMANTLLATTGIAFVALSRGQGTFTDSSSWATVGDRMLGAPLYVAGLVAALWLMLRPHDRGEVVEQLTDEVYDPVEAAAADAAMAWTPASPSPPVAPPSAPPPPPPPAPPPPPPPPPGYPGST